MYCVIASPGGVVLRAAASSPSRSGCPRSTPAPRPAAPASPSAAATTPPRSSPSAQAVEQGCDQVVWLDAVEHRWVEEMGGMNLFFVYGRPTAAGHPGADRHPAARHHPGLAAALAADLGIAAEEGRHLGRRVAGGLRVRRAHRGVRLRHRRGDHPGRLGEGRRPATGPSATATRARSPCGCARSCSASSTARAPTPTAGCTRSSKRDRGAGRPTQATPAPPTRYFRPSGGCRPRGPMITISSEIARAR